MRHAGRVFYVNLGIAVDAVIGSDAVDPVRNPYAPGAGQRPPELAGRDRELGQFEVVLERIARGRPERSMVLTGLRGVGKTVLLNSFRSMALQRLWGTGKIEARPEQTIRRPVAGALHMAVRELAPRHRAPDRIEHFLGVLKAFAARDPKAPKGSFTPHLGIDVPPVRGRADSGDLEIDLTELLADAASVATDLAVGIALFVDEMQDIPSADVSVAAPEAEGELAVGFFGSRYERATLAERQYMRAMAATGDDPVPTSVVADELGRKPSSLSPARDGLIKKGLIYSSERGLIAFTVPHFGKFLRSQPV